MALNDGRTPQKWEAYHEKDFLKNVGTYTEPNQIALAHGANLDRIALRILERYRRATELRSRWELPYTRIQALAMIDEEMDTRKRRLRNGG